MSVRENDEQTVITSSTGKIDLSISKFVLASTNELKKANMRVRTIGQPPVGS